MNAKNLIVGFCTNMPLTSVLALCRSARVALPANDTEIVLITDDPQVYAEGLRGLEVSFHLTTCDYKVTTSKSAKLFKRIAVYATRSVAGGFLDRKFWDGACSRILPTLLESWCHPWVARWIAYDTALKERPYIERVLLTDVKDVVIQGDCFAHLHGDRVQVFQEGIELQNESSNVSWIRNGFGKTALDSLKGVEVICMGTVLATRTAAIPFLEFARTIFTRYPYRTADQATITYMLHKHGDPAYLERVPNITGPIATLSSRPARDAVEMRNGLIVRRADGSVIPIVHMWDRWDLKDAVLARYDIASARREPSSPPA